MKGKRMKRKRRMAKDWVAKRTENAKRTGGIKGRKEFKKIDVWIIRFSFTEL